MDHYSYIFDAFGKTLKISGDWSPCLRDIISWYSMPMPEASAAPDLTMEISGASIEEMNRLIPLPAEEFRLRSGILAVNENIDYVSYSDNKRHWVDYAGAGRIMTDFENGSAASLVCSGIILPTYQKYLFSDHPLDRLLASRGIFSMHASCASVNGKGIAFTGRSGAGKSSAAFALMQKGMPILTDEKLFIFKKDEGYSGGAVSDIIKVRHDAISMLFPKPASCRKFDVIGEEHYFKLGTSESYNWQERVTLKALCMLEKTGAPKTEIMAINPTKLAGGLFPVTITGVSPRYRAEKFSFIMELLENIECRLVKFGTDMDDFARAVVELAENL
jgi:hypothetical protein